MGFSRDIHKNCDCNLIHKLRTKPKTRSLYEQTAEISALFGGSNNGVGLCPLLVDRTRKCRDVVVR